MPYVYALTGLAFALSATLTWLLARQFQGTALMDEPNERSSHTKAKPKGGGLAIVGAALMGLSLLHGLELLGFAAWFAFGLVGLGVGLSGFLDDQRLVSLEFRLLAQFAAAIVGLVVVGGFPALPLDPIPIDLGWGGAIIGCLFLVWSMNLFNFMDGIDGLVATGASTSMAAAAGLAALAGLELPYIAIPLTFAGAAAGFLVWNIPPARIFMGSVGSEYLGYFVALAAIYLGHADPRLFWAILILIAYYVSDATMTLLMRLLAGQNILHAHRSHAYQLLAQRFGAHRPATLAVLAVTAIWLAPIAFMTARGLLNPIVATCVAYVPLCVFVIAYRLRHAPPQQPAT